MSFSAEVKSELCRVPINRRCCAIAECYGVLLTCHTFSDREIRIVTEHGDFARRLPKLFSKAFSVEFDDQPASEPEGGKYRFSIRDPGKIESIYRAFDLTPAGNVSLHLNRGALEQDCCDLAFARGAFLCGGSVTDPEKRYHLELTTTHGRVLPELDALLLDLGFSPRDTEHNGIYMLYFKQSDQIEDLLTAIGAPVSAMRLMEAKVEKDLRNVVNRRCNCETANLSKVVDAAQLQLAAIRKLRKNGVFADLPKQLRETAEFREHDPEATLSEIAEAFGVTKSAVNHRMRKLIELSRQ